MCYLKKGRQLIVKMTSQQKKQEALNILLKKGSTINSLNGQQAEKKTLQDKNNCNPFLRQSDSFCFSI